MNDVAPADPVTQLLGGDHHRLDAILADVKRCLAAGDLSLAAAGFAELRAGLERHMRAEEEILFPAFEALDGTASGRPAAVMRAEHVELRQLMAEVASHLERGGDEGRAMPLAALTARIYAHNGKEERILYPAIAHAARDAGDLDAVLDELRAALSPPSR